MNWRMQYVIAFITMSIVMQDEDNSTCTIAHRMLREEYGVSKEEWKEFSRLMIQEGKIVTQRIAEITAKIAIVFIVGSTHLGAGFLRIVRVPFLAELVAGY